MPPETITIPHRFHGPEGSGNGGYVSGRLAAFLPGTARVRLYVPPPLGVPLALGRDGSVTLWEGDTKIAEAWEAELDLEPPRPPDLGEAREASGRFRGFRSHRFPSCFVCGPEREAGDGLRIFAGPLRDRPLVACTWTPDAGVTGEDGTVAPEYVWCALDCPGGFAFPEPETGTILLGELTVSRYRALDPGETVIVAGWEILAEGRKHHTGTALYSETGQCLAIGRGTWFEVGEVESQPGVAV
jgi:hypothetical protein